jgi:hypothetical protein
VISVFLFVCLFYVNLKNTYISKGLNLMRSDEYQMKTNYIKFEIQLIYKFETMFIKVFVFLFV